MGVLLLGFAPEEIDPAALEQVRGLAPDLRVVATRERSAIEALLDQVEIAAGGVPHDLVARAPRLRWFQQWGAGADWLLRHPAAADRDFVLTNASGVHAIPIGEHIVGTLLMFARGLHRAARAQARRDWWEPQPGEQLMELERTRAELLAYLRGLDQPTLARAQPWDTWPGTIPDYLLVSLRDHEAEHIEALRAAAAEVIR